MCVEKSPVSVTQHIGPGSYDNEKYTNLAYVQNRKPVSKKGYSMGARTESRSPSVKMETPSPSDYQSVQRKPPTVPPFWATFGSKVAQSLVNKTDATENPGPGTYEGDANVGRKIIWPGRFGAPDWSNIPAYSKKTFRAKLAEERAFNKKRHRIAYWNLYK
ncbi:ciliary microtubule-associated protein 3 [Pelobates fuscus]|uniref:ciliary microtubule-associated protein 3 n=1 Tax=Pelobates fuscus TaxID=191477 RepID=UPI002FE44B9B